MKVMQLLSEEDIRDTVLLLAERINRDYKSKEVVFIGVLNGAFMFFSDLMKEITLKIEIDFIGVNSYRNDEVGELVLTKDISVDIKDKIVIVVDDLLDTGGTKKYITNHLKDKGASEIKWCFFLSKKMLGDYYVGQYIPPEFYVYGYGMDLSGKERNLKQIYYK